MKKLLIVLVISLWVFNLVCLGWLCFTGVRPWEYAHSIPAPGFKIVCDETEQYAWQSLDAPDWSSPWRKSGKQAAINETWAIYEIQIKDASSKWKVCNQ